MDTKITKKFDFGAFYPRSNRSLLLYKFENDICSACINASYFDNTVKYIVERRALGVKRDEYDDIRSALDAVAEHMNSRVPYSIDYRQVRTHFESLWGIAKVGIYPPGHRYVAKMRVRGRTTHHVLYDTGEYKLVERVNGDLVEVGRWLTWEDALAVMKSRVPEGLKVHVPPTLRSGKAGKSPRQEQKSIVETLEGSVDESNKEKNMLDNLMDTVTDMGEALEEGLKMSAANELNIEIVALSTTALEGFGLDAEFLKSDRGQIVAKALAPIMLNLSLNVARDLIPGGLNDTIREGTKLAMKANAYEGGKNVIRGIRGQVVAVVEKAQALKQISDMMTFDMPDVAKPEREPVAVEPNEVSK